MTKEHFYPTPRTATELPSGLLAHFDGKGLKDKIGGAIRVTTVDTEGWPHNAQLSVGEILAVDAQHIRFAISPKSTTTANIRCNGRLVFSLVHQGEVWEIRLQAKHIGDTDTGHNTVLFEATVQDARIHAVPYADVLSGLRYALKDTDAVLARWALQIDHLRAAVS